jgi:hypothetical protein
MNELTIDLTHTLKKTIYGVRLSKLTKRLAYQIK